MYGIRKHSTYDSIENTSILLTQIHNGTALLRVEAAWYTHYANYIDWTNFHVNGVVPFAVHSLFSRSVLHNLHVLWNGQHRQQHLSQIIFSVSLASHSDDEHQTHIFFGCSLCNKTSRLCPKFVYFSFSYYLMLVPVMLSCLWPFSAWHTIQMIYKNHCIYSLTNATHVIACGAQFSSHLFSFEH